MTEKACKRCRLITTSDTCVVCKDSQLTASWKGYAIVFDPEKSEIAKRLEIKTPGKYALRLSK